MKQKILFLLAGFLFAATTLQAQEEKEEKEEKTEGTGSDIFPIVVERPFQTASPFVVPKNHLQMENVFSFEQTDDVTRTITLPSTLLKFGVNNYFELGVLTSVMSIKGTYIDELGLTPLTFRIKETICDEKGIIPATSFLTYFKVPRLGTNNYDIPNLAPAFRLAMENTVSKKFYVGYNLGVEWFGFVPEPTYLYTLNWGWFATKKLTACVELYGFLPSYAPNDHRVDCGFTYLFKNNIMVNISGGTQIQTSKLKLKSSPAYFVAAGFSFRLKN